MGGGEERLKDEISRRRKMMRQAREYTMPAFISLDGERNNGIDAIV